MALRDDIQLAITNMIAKYGGVVNGSPVGLPPGWPNNPDMGGLAGGAYAGPTASPVIRLNPDPTAVMGASGAQRAPAPPIAPSLPPPDPSMGAIRPLPPLGGEGAIRPLPPLGGESAIRDLFRPEARYEPSLALPAKPSPNFGSLNDGPTHGGITDSNQLVPTGGPGSRSFEYGGGNFSGGSLNPLSYEDMVQRVASGAIGAPGQVGGSPGSVAHAIFGQAAGDSGESMIPPGDGMVAHANFPKFGGGDSELGWLPVPFSGLEDRWSVPERENPFDSFAQYVQNLLGG